MLPPENVLADHDFPDAFFWCDPSDIPGDLVALCPQARVFFETAWTANHLVGDVVRTRKEDMHI